MGDLTDFGNIFLIRANEHFNKCRYVEFLYMVDQRFSSWKFTSGLLTKLVIQLAQYPNTVPYKSFNKMSESFNANDWEGVGLGLQLFLSKMVNFIAPRIKTNPDTY